MVGIRPRDPKSVTFYHGVELLLKGFLQAVNNVQKDHGLLRVLRCFELKIGNADNKLATTLAPYISSIDSCSLLGNFLAENCISIDRWYEVLRYPESLNGKPFSHLVLKWESIQTCEFWHHMTITAHTLQAEAVSLARNRGWSA